MKNVDLTRRILQLLGKPESLIRPVADRPGTIAATRSTRPNCTRSAGSHASPSNKGLADTVAWYQQNEWWWRPIKEGDPAFQAYYKTQYGERQG